MNIVAICALGIITSILSLSIKRYNSEISLLIAIAGGIFIVISLISSLSDVLSTVNRIISKSEIDINYIAVLIKAVGICFVTEFACNCCKDAGQNALASNISVAGKLMILVTAIPLYSDILNTILSLTGGVI